VPQVVAVCCRADTPTAMIVDCMLNQDAAQAFDLIRINGEPALQVLPSCPSKV
jgi:hypothetical protein